MLPVFLDLVRSYARLGMADWARAPDWVKLRAMECLENRIVDNEYELTQTIEATSKGGWDDRFKFIPMPNVNHVGIARCFFLPIREAVQEGVGPVSFDLFLLIDEEHCLGYRYEPADGPGSSHGYCHVQMNTVMFRSTLPVGGVQPWLPTSYPAFPIRASGPIQMFLMMATSIHGYGAELDGGISSILLDIYKNTSAKARSFIKELETILITN